MQHNRVIVYASRQPKPYEQKYPTHNLGLTVIIFVLKDLGNMICMEKGVRSIRAIRGWSMCSRGKAKIEESNNGHRNYIRGINYRILKVGIGS